MSKFIRTTGFFLLLTAIVYPVLIAIWGSTMPQMLMPNLNYRKGSNGHLFTRIDDLKNYSDIDLLFMGSSHAYRGFDTRIFEDAGYKSFNLGSSGQTPINGQVLLRRYLDILNPKVLIYEVFPGNFNSDGVESSLDIIANDQNDINSLNMAWKVFHLKTFNTLIYGLYRDLFQSHDSFEEPSDKGGDHYVKGGFVEKDVMYNVPKEMTERNWQWNASQFQSFEENIALLREKQIEVILVQAPITRNLYQAFTDNDEFDKKMEAYGMYFNFNNILEVNDSLHFYDQHHLNQIGVEMFNENVIDIVPLDSLRSS